MNDVRIINRACIVKMPGQLTHHDETEIMKTSVPLVNLRKTFTSAEGKDVDTIVTKVPLRDTTGEITGTLGIITEVGDSGNTGGGDVKCREIAPSRRGPGWIDA